jgi:hypothetical protein
MDIRKELTQGTLAPIHTTIDPIHRRCSPRPVPNPYRRSTHNRGWQPTVLLYSNCVTGTTFSRKHAREFRLTRGACTSAGHYIPLETPGIVSNYGSFQHIVAPGKEHVIGHTDWSSCERKNAQDWFRCQSLPRERRRRAAPWSPTRPLPGRARQQGNLYVFSQKRGIDLQTAIIKPLWRVS